MHRYHIGFGMDNGGFGGCIGFGTCTGGFQGCIGFGSTGAGGFCGCIGSSTCTGGFCGCAGSGMCTGRFCGICTGRGSCEGNLVYVLESLARVVGQVCAVGDLCQEGFVGWEELGFVPGL